MDLRTGAVVAPAFLAEKYEEGLYVTFRYNASARFRFNQAHSDTGDLDGWPPRPLLSGVFFD